jgi:hypothetical protein
MDDAITTCSVRVFIYIQDLRALATLFSWSELLSILTIAAWPWKWSAEVLRMEQSAQGLQDISPSSTSTSTLDLRMVALQQSKRMEMDQVQDTFVRYAEHL